MIKHLPVVPHTDSCANTHGCHKNSYVVWLQRAGRLRCNVPGDCAAHRSAGGRMRHSLASLETQRLWQGFAANQYGGASHPQQLIRDHDCQPAGGAAPYACDACNHHTGTSMDTFSVVQHARQSQALGSHRSGRSAVQRTANLLLPQPSCCHSPPVQDVRQRRRPVYIPFSSSVRSSRSSEFVMPRLRMANQDVQSVGFGQIASEQQQRLETRKQAVRASLQWKSNISAASISSHPATSSPSIMSMPKSVRCAQLIWPRLASVPGVTHAPFSTAHAPMMTFMLANVGLWQITTLRLTSKAGMAAGRKGRFQAQAIPAPRSSSGRCVAVHARWWTTCNLHDLARSG